MRIECEVCSATYTIDDAQLSDQPIGAQCPYCGHVKLVRKGDQAAKAPGGIPTFGTTSAQDLGFGGPPPGFSPGGSASASADLGPGLTINSRNQRPNFPGPASAAADLGVPPFGSSTGTGPAGGGAPGGMPSWKVGNTQSSALGRT